MLRASLVTAFCAAPRLSTPACGASRQLAGQFKSVTSAAAPRPRRPQRSAAGGKATYAAYAGHDAKFNNATCQEASEQLTKGAVYLDVRTPEEYQMGRVPGSVCVPVWVKGPAGMQPNPDFLKEVEAKFADKGIPLVVGCKSGRRSEVACDMMTKAGFSGLTNMLGGFDAWAAAQLPVEQ